MALGVLLIIYIILIVIAIVIQILLYGSKHGSKNSIFVINMLFGVLLSSIAYASWPINYMELRALAIALGVLSVLAVVMRVASKKFTRTGKVMLTISIIGSFLQLLV